MSITEKEMQNVENVYLEEPPNSPLSQRIGLVLGPLLFILFHFFLRPASMSPQAGAVLASTLWIATWWVTEALPIPATSLLPLVLFPALGISKMGEVTAAYADPTVYLFLGGFLIALAVEKWNLHRRIALSVISILGMSPSRLLLGFLLSTGLLSMWLSNTATAMMMLPIGLAVATQVKALQLSGHEELLDDAAFQKGQSNFATGLMLSIAYGASLGGVGTLIGSPPNAVFAGVVAKTLHIQIGFLQWMLLAVPLMLIMMAASWFILLKVFPPHTGEVPGGRELIRREIQDLGPITTEEKWALLVFIMTSFLWISRPYLLKGILPNVDDSVIAIFGGLLLFVLPTSKKKGQRMLMADAIQNIPWGILLLFGAGFAIARNFEISGLSQWLGASLTALQGVSYVWILLASIALVLALTEVTSNTAVATLMMPIMAALGNAIDVAPVGLMAAAALAASLAFMLPVATPPNAIVFASGHVKIGDMIKAGIWLNLLSIILLTLFIYFWLPVVW